MGVLRQLQSLHSLLIYMQSMDVYSIPVVSFPCAVGVRLYRTLTAIIPLRSKCLHSSGHSTTAEAFTFNTDSSLYTNVNSVMYDSGSVSEWTIFNTHHIVSLRSNCLQTSGKAVYGSCSQTGGLSTNALCFSLCFSLSLSLTLSLSLSLCAFLSLSLSLSRALSLSPTHTHTHTISLSLCL